MSRLPAYAPTTNSSFTLASANPQVNYHERFSRHSVVSTATEKAVYDSLCEIYSIITVMQMVENGYVKDYLTDKDKYTATVMRLVHQYNILETGLWKTPSHEAAVARVLPDLAPDHSNFLTCLTQRFRLHAPLAVDRLTSGVPATIEHLNVQVESSGDDVVAGTENRKSTASARLVAEATGNFITLMDAVKLEYRTKGQLHPLLSSLVVCLNDLVRRESGGVRAMEFPGKSKLVNWLIKLNNLGELDSITALEADAFLQDLDSAYHGFYELLE